MTVADLPWMALACILRQPRVLGGLQRIAARTPYFDIDGPDGSIYMRRWWLMPRWCLDFDEDRGYPMPKRWMPFSIRLHHIMRPDADRHLHDHPFNFRTVVLAGGYMEQDEHNGPANRVRPVLPGDTYRSPAGRFHRIAVVSSGGAWSLFVMGRARRLHGALRTVLQMAEAGAIWQAAHAGLMADAANAAKDLAINHADLAMRLTPDADWIAARIRAGVARVSDVAGAEVYARGNHG